MIKQEKFQDYLDHPAINASTLKKLKRSPLSAFGAPDFETGPMAFGTKYHSYILEPDKFDIQYYMLDEAPILAKLIKEGSKSPRATKKYKEWLEKETKKAEDKIIVELDELEKLKDMASQLIINNPKALTLINSTTHEVSVYQTIEIDGQNYECKGLMDGLFVSQESGIIFDLKTTKDAHPDHFPREAGRLGYHIQMAFYQMLVEAEYNKPFHVFIIAQEKDKPYNSGVYHIKETMLNKGRYEVANLLKTAAHVLETGHMKSYEIFANNENGILELDIPDYFIHNYDNNQ